MVIEAIGGILSGSLALLADAGHMLTDTVALFLTWLAFGLGMKPADHERTYGYHRFPILAAFTNGICMLFVENLDAIEDVHHIHAWSLAQDRSLLTLHARIGEGVHADSAIDAIHRRLVERFDVTHVTVQIEIESCVDYGPVMPAPSRAFTE